MLYNKLFPLADCIEFDELETFEGTKKKPLSVIMAVEHKTRRILGYSVSQMPAKGRLAILSLKKYGPRKDERAEGRRLLFEAIAPLVRPEVVIKSDQSPHYPRDVKKYFPQATHLRYLGRKPADTGQGELKRGAFDPIFSLNHTFAKSRDDIKRLARKTWCTTKRKDRLDLNFAIFAMHHNWKLLARQKV